METLPPSPLPIRIKTRQRTEVRLDELRLGERIEPTLRRVEETKRVPGQKLRMRLAERVGRRDRDRAPVRLHDGGDQVQKGPRGRLVVARRWAFFDAVGRVERLDSGADPFEGLRKRMSHQIEVSGLHMRAVSPLV